MAAEVLGKVWIAYYTKKIFSDRRVSLKSVGGGGEIVVASREVATDNEKVASTLPHKQGAFVGMGGGSLEAGDAESSTNATFASSPPTGRAAAEPTGAAASRPLTRNKLKELELKQSCAMLLLAVRWNAEQTAEKAGILVASLIAITTFDDGGRLSAKALLLIAAIFYGIECVTDFVFVYIMNRFFDIPLLAAKINESEFFTKRVLADSVVMGKCPTQKTPTTFAPYHKC